jgi:RNA polymerase sigma factor (sigma-70 family)
MVRRLGREPELAEELSVSDTAPGADQSVQQADLRAAVETALGELEPRCRQLLLGLFVDPEHPSYRELARELGVEPNTIGSLRSRCLDRLRRILRKMGWEVH